jgi:hypothetical protein
VNTVQPMAICDHSIEPRNSESMANFLNRRVIIIILKDADQCKYLNVYFT